MLTVDFRRLKSVLPDGSARLSARILDLGCGEGRHLRKAGEFSGVQAAGVDRDMNALRTAKQRWAEHRKMISCNGDATLVAADVLCLPFPDNSFDLTICSEVLEHVPDHKTAAVELARVTKPSGIVVVSVPRRLPERICWALSDSYHANDGGHIRIYTQKQLIELFKQAGLVPFARHWAHAFHTPYWWLKCLVEKDASVWGRWLVDWYHWFLVWDLMNRPWALRRVEEFLDPVLGKSFVVYFCFA